MSKAKRKSTTEQAPFPCLIFRNASTKLEALPDHAVLDVFTRDDAIASGQLIDAGPLAKEAGFNVPVALSAAAWHQAVEWTDEDTKRTGNYQDQTGRLWDVLFLAAVAVRAKPAHRVPFQVLCVPRSGGDACPIKLDVEIGEDYHGNPEVSIGLEGED